MQNLSPRHVKTEESLRLGVESGWYSTKVSGTFVTGPHATQEDCLSKIAELNPPVPGRSSKSSRHERPAQSRETRHGAHRQVLSENTTTTGWSCVSR